MEDIFFQLLGATCQLSASLFYNGAPNRAFLRVDVRSLTFDQMHAFHGRTLEMFFMIFNTQTGGHFPDFFQGEFFRRILAPNSPDFEWMNHCEVLVGKKPFNFVPFARDYILKISSFIPFNSDSLSVAAVAGLMAAYYGQASKQILATSK